MYHAETIDVAVIGGGHAGCEAALAAARLGMRTVLFAISLDSIAMMPCNPSIGGSSKGHLVREVDALGGEMGKVIDKTYIQTKMLNTGKGPAVYSLRAQADKQAYQSEMKHRLENTPNLKIKQAEIVDIRMENGRVSGVVTAAGAVYDCKAAVLCMGTYMKARCLTGEHITESGPNNLMPATKLSARLREMGIDLFRFKTGTPARMNKNSLDLEKMQKAASYLIGEHDFKSFCTVRTQAEETVRTIYSLTVTKADDLITIRISGSGFLYNMVRIIAGTLVKIGMGVYPPEKMEEILEEKNRAAAGPTIPARGLTLVSLEYEKELAPYLEGENKHWHYVLDQRNVPEKGLAYLTIKRCEPEELDGVLRRVIHQAYRNGAKQVFVRDAFGEEGSIYGYYRLRRQPEVEEGWLEAIYEGEHQ